MAGGSTSRSHDRKGELLISGLIQGIEVPPWATPAAKDYRYPNTKSYAERGGFDKGGDAEQPSGAWGNYYVAHCRDGKARRVGTGLQPLALGVPRSVRLLLSRLESLGIDPEHLDRRVLTRVLRLAKSNRVTRLRGYGNAIVPSLAAEFILAFVDTAK